MKTPRNVLPIAVFLVLPAIGGRAAENAPTVAFKKHKIDSVFRSEGVAVADFNGDGQLDIAAGSVFYAGPDWTMHAILEEPKSYKQKGYSDAFLCFAEDINGDGRIDLVVVGYPGRQTYWYANPGATGKPWKRYLAVEKTGNESPAWLDLDGDGRHELIFAQRPGPMAFARPGKDPTQPWTIHALGKGPGAGHGLGAGDMNGDGRLDVVIPSGWYEAPADRGKPAWVFHKANLGKASAQMIVYDVDGDGDRDVLSSSAHAFGIWWHERTPDGWTTHEIDKSISQTHALHLADMNGDGLPDFVTGKRWWAHNGRDPGADQPAVLCWFELSRRNGRPVWTKHQIDDNSGVGLHAVVIDVNGDGLLDVVTSNKKGVHYFEQIRKPPAAP